MITHVIYHVRLCLDIFLDLIHLENLLFKWLSALSSDSVYILVLLVVLRGNLSYGKTVFLNKVACTLDHYYWHIGLS